MSKEIVVKYLSGDVNYWVVRPGKDGIFLDHFQKGGIVALGHLDAMNYLDSDLNDKSLFIKLKVNFIRKLTDGEKTKKASASNKAGQVDNFVNAIKVGDVVVSMNGRRYMAGVVKSKAYKDTKTIEIKDIKGEAVGPKLEYSLRRDVEWITTTSKKEIPTPVKISFKANQTVFNVTEHWRTLNHWLSIIFINDGVVYFSTKIRQESDISNFDISRYGLILNKLEVVANVLSEFHDNGKLAELKESEVNKLIAERYDYFVENRLFKLTTQQSFMSPGDFWGALPSNTGSAIIFIMCISEVFGMNPAFADGMDSILAQETKGFTVAATNTIMEEEKFDIVRNSIKVMMPEQKKLDIDNITFPDDEPDDFTGM